MDWEDEVRGFRLPNIDVGPEDRKTVKERILFEINPAYAFGDDQTRATATLRNHLFYTVPFFFFTVTMHWIAIQVSSTNL